VLAAIPVKILCDAYEQRHLPKMCVALAVLVFNVRNLVVELLSTIADYRWSILMVLGIALIFGASYVEKGARRVVQHWRKDK
jgi:hypothetical protein